MRAQYYLLVVIIWVAYNVQQFNGNQIGAQCNTQLNCSECVSTPFCAWCLQSELEFGNKPRCFNSELSKRRFCPEEYIYSPGNKIIIQKNIQPDQWKSDATNSNLPQVQLSPQVVAIKLRRDEMLQLVLRFTPAGLGAQKQSVELKNNASLAVEFNIEAKCSEGEPFVAKKSCENLQVGQIAEFRISLLLIKCPSSPKDWSEVIEVFPQPDPLKEKLLIALDMICSCPCENPGHASYEVKSPKCSLGGTYKCGICECDQYRYGRQCECNLIEKRADYESGCRPQNSTKSTVHCSGRGSCICGLCECEMQTNIDEVITGKYCECDNFSCPKYDNQLCGGSSQGVCECGKCKCIPPWQGDACSTT